MVGICQEHPNITCVWRLGTRRWNLRVLNLQMSGSDLIKWRGATCSLAVMDNRVTYPIIGRIQSVLNTNLLTISSWFPKPITQSHCHVIFVDYKWCIENITTSISKHITTGHGHESRFVEYNCDWVNGLRLVWGVYSQNARQHVETGRQFQSTHCLHVPEFSATANPDRPVLIIQHPGNPCGEWWCTKIGGFN